MAVDAVDHVGFAVQEESFLRIDLEEAQSPAVRPANRSPARLA